MQTKLVKIRVKDPIYNAIRDGFQPFVLVDERENVNTGDSLWIFPQGAERAEGKHLHCFVIYELHHFDKGGQGIEPGFMAVTVKGVAETEG